MTKAKYKISEPPHCPTCSCGLHTDKCLHLHIDKFFANHGHVYFCNSCGLQMHFVPKSTGAE